MTVYVFFGGVSKITWTGKTCLAFFVAFVVLQILVFVFWLNLQNECPYFLYDFKRIIFNGNCGQVLSQW